MPRFAEFFAGAGMVSAALRPDWQLAFANDIDAKKCATYRRNWGDAGLIEGDIGALDPHIWRQPIDLYWASSPCQDVSLAGNRSGLNASRSGLFHTWMRHVTDARNHGYAPRLLAFENVTGLITSGQGKDFHEVARAFQTAGYRFGALEIDARWFLPQSRPRVFVIGIREDIQVPSHLIQARAGGPFHTARLESFQKGLPADLRRNWLWWKLAQPVPRKQQLQDIIDPRAAAFFEEHQTQALLALMDAPSRERIAQACAAGGLHIGTIYKRGRPDKTGAVRQRAELRMDGLAGCLRTPGGGSSRQTVVIIQDGHVAMRLLTPREAVRLMGLDDSYILPTAYNEAYKLAGDGVAVPVVRLLKLALFEPLLLAPTTKMAA